MGRCGGGGASVSECQARFPAFGWVQEAAVGVSFDAECENEVPHRNSVAVQGDGVGQVFGSHDLHRLEGFDAYDLFLDAVLPSVGTFKVMLGFGVAGARR